RGQNSLQPSEVTPRTLPWPVRAMPRPVIPLVSLVCFVVFLLRCQPAIAADEGRALALEYRGKLRLNTDTATDQNGQQFKIEGLSGVAWCGGDKYVAV